MASPSVFLQSNVTQYMSLETWPERTDTALPLAEVARLLLHDEPRWILICSLSLVVDDTLASMTRGSETVQLHACCTGIPTESSACRSTALVLVVTPAVITRITLMSSCCAYSHLLHCRLKCPGYHQVHCTSTEMHAHLNHLAQSCRCNGQTDKQLTGTARRSVPQSPGICRRCSRRGHPVAAERAAGVMGGPRAYRAMHLLRSVTSVTAVLDGKGTWPERRRACSMLQPGQSLMSAKCDQIDSKLGVPRCNWHMHKSSPPRHARAATSPSPRRCIRYVSAAVTVVIWMCNNTVGACARIQCYGP